MSRWTEMLASEPGASLPEFLADTSALSRLGNHPGVRAALADLLAAGQIAWCDPTRLEMGLSARNGPDHADLERAFYGLPHARISPRDYDRAWQVQGRLAALSRHRGIALPDLLVAACVERLSLTVIHCDADFDAIAEVTGQPTRWAADRESL